MGIKQSALLALLAAVCGAVQAAPLLPAADPRIARMGRTADAPDGALRFAYPGVRLTFAFTGKSAAFEASTSGSQSYLEAVIDGGDPRRIKLSKERQRYVLVDDSQPGQHTVEIMHRSETWHGVVTLHGFQVGGQLNDAPQLPARKMLVLGDSVTCAEGVDRGSGAKDSSWTDPRHSYGMLAAGLLDAQVQLVCYGGRGLVRSWNNRTDEFNLPDFYELAIADATHPEPWNQASFQADLIVSAIGTNDFSSGVPERESYVFAYVTLVRKLLRDHPHARVVLTEGAILKGAKKAVLRSYIAEVVAQVADARVSAARSWHHPGDERDAHPTGAQHAAMARELAPQLRRVMGW